MSEILEQLKAALAGRYTIEREIGYGGMATVYLAEDVKHRRKVAVKVLRPELAANLGTDRFLREIEIAAQLNHPHILPLLDSGEAEGLLYYVMPYVVGDSLRKRMGSEKPSSLDDAVRIASQIASALEHAHRQGVVHRDIKPENVLFSEGLAVVTDFGIAKAVSTVSREALTRSGFPLGTPGYMSPEQAAGNTTLDTRTDVCSLACVVYELLVGETPGVWTTPDEVRIGRFAMLSPGHRERLDRMPGRVEQVLTKALAMRTDERYATPAEFANALAAASEPSGKIADAKVREIIDRAAEISAEPTAEERALSMGGVEQIAAEVGIAPAQVREAVLAVENPHPGVVRGGYLGVTGKIEHGTDVGVALSREQYPAFLSEIRRTVGDVGQMIETFDESFFWEGRLPSSKRRVQVMIIPAVEGAQIRITEFREEENDMLVVPPIIATVLVAALMAGTITNGVEPVIACIGGATVWVGHYVAIRTWYRRFVEKRGRVMTGLLERLSKLAVRPEDQKTLVE